MAGIEPALYPEALLLGRCVYLLRHITLAGFVPTTGRTGNLSSSNPSAISVWLRGKLIIGLSLPPQKPLMKSLCV